MNLRRALPVLALLLLGACVHRPADPADAPARSGPPRAFALLEETPERETTQLGERREDVEVDTRDFDRVPHVVARGETPLIRLEGARALLAGDPRGERGWEVDNFVLLEVLDEHDRVIARGNVGYAQGVIIGAERIDNVGRMAFRFEPGEVDVTRLLPESRPFKLRATALDVGGVGRVSSVYLVLDHPRRARDELRGE